MKLVLVALALAAGCAVGCAAPSIGEEPLSSSNDRSNDTSDDDDDDSTTTKEKSSSTTSADTAPISTTTVTNTDAGTATTTTACTESGAVQFQGHCYFALTTAASWDNAKAACTAKNAHLATLTSAAEESIAGALDPTDERWIGLSRPAGSAAKDASYVWVTAEPRSFADWDAAKSEPDGSCPTCSNSAPALCARILTAGGWADDSCAVPHPALCERD